MKVNFKNTAENLIIIIIVGLLGGFIGHRVTIGTIKAEQPLIKQAIDKNTSEIKNTFENEFKKVKNKKGEPINILIDPSSNSVISSDTTKVIDVKKKKGIFKKLFGN